MLVALIQAVPQLAKQVAPNLYVIVQQPPAGMPEWVKILISAGTGAVLGIASNVLMEYLKPLIAAKTTSRQLKDELTEELTGNLDLLQSLKSYLAATKDDSGVEDIDIYSRAISVATDATRDRYDYFYEENKILLHKMPGKKFLIRFYGSIRALLNYAQAQNLKGVLISTESACLEGALFLKENAIAYVKQPTTYDRMDELTRSGFDFAHARGRKPAEENPVQTQPAHPVEEPGNDTPQTNSL